MSHKIALPEKRKWLEMFENGMTESQIAEKTSKDLRTIVSGLQEASKARHLANAEMEMLRNALFSHQDKLTAILKGISLMFVLPPTNLELHEDENGFLAPIPLPGSLIEQTPEKQITLKIHNEEKLEWELLEQHLKGDKLWSSIKKWRQAMTNHIRAKWEIKNAIKALLVKRTGLTFKGKGNQQTDYLVSGVVDLFYEVTINRLLGVKDGTDLEHNLTADESGFVRHGSSELAHCHDAAQCRDKIIFVFNSLPETPDALAVKNTFAELATITKVARRQVDEILLLGMITGKCRVCVRLGK